MAARPRGPGAFSAGPGCPVLRARDSPRGSNGRGQAAVLRERRHGAMRALGAPQPTERPTPDSSGPQSSRGCTPTLAIATPHLQTPNTSLTCSQKIVVTVELENNKIYETEQLNFGVSCVNRRGKNHPIVRPELSANTATAPLAAMPHTIPQLLKSAPLPSRPPLQPHRHLPLSLQLCDRPHLRLPRPQTEHHCGRHKERRVCTLPTHLLQIHERTAVRGALPCSALP